jgi:hypothetical protein
VEGERGVRRTAPRRGTKENKRREKKEKKERTNFGIGGVGTRGDLQPQARAAVIAVGQLVQGVAEGGDHEAQHVNAVLVILGRVGNRFFAAAHAGCPHEGGLEL